MDAVVPVLIAKVLDGLSARATVAAENIANANTPNYRPMAVKFEESLRAAAAKGNDAIADVQPQIEAQQTGRFGTEMRLDLEIATAAQTAMRYAALIDILGRQMQLQRAVVAGGR